MNVPHSHLSSQPLLHRKECEANFGLTTSSRYLIRENKLNHLCERTAYCS